MKKSNSISWVSFVIMLLSLTSISGCNECKNEASDIPLANIKGYADNYADMVKSHPDWVTQVSIITNKELYCLSKLSPKEVMFISAAYDKNKEETKFIIVKAKDENTETYHYYDLDSMYPKICPVKINTNGSGHLCPLPNSGCGIP